MKTFNSVFSRKSNWNSKKKMVDIPSQNVDALLLTGYYWIYPFKYRCSSRQKDLLCRSYYKIINIKLQDLGF